MKTTKVLQPTKKMNSPEFLKRVNTNGRYVVSSFGSFKDSFDVFKQSTANEHNSYQIAKLDRAVRDLETNVKNLQRSIDISQEPRFNRRY